MQAPGLFDLPNGDKRGKYGLVHNIGLGGAVVVSLLRRPEFYQEGGIDGRDRWVLIPHVPSSLPPFLYTCPFLRPISDKLWK